MNKELSKSGSGNGFTKSMSKFTKEYMSLVGIVLLIIIFSILSYVKHGEQYFLTVPNWTNILLQSSTVAIVAMGQGIILLTGNFDLSLGRMVGVTSAVGAVLMKNHGVNPVVAILILCN